MILVDIPSATKEDKHYVYNVIVTVERDSGSQVFKSNRRFSDFVRLRDELQKESHRIVPYKLPSKLTLMKSDEEVAKERKPALAQFSQKIVTDPRYQSTSTVLSFYNVPRSTFMELKPSDESDGPQRGSTSSKSGESANIDSPNKWLDVLKGTKSMLQEVRTKLFSNGNVVDCRAQLKSSKKRIDALEAYLKADHGLGSGELARRREMLDGVEQDYNELDSLVTGFVSGGAAAKRPSGAGNGGSIGSGTSYGGNGGGRSGSDADRSQLFSGSTGGSGRRTLGKPRETAATRQLDNKELYQSQQQLMKDQDQQLETLQMSVQQQKQLGLAINQELDEQNEMLKDLNQRVDNSHSKMQTARKNIKKVL